MATRRPGKVSRDGGGWRKSFGSLALLSVAVYAVGRYLGHSGPSSVMGMGFGIAAAVFLLAVTGWAVRRRMMATATKLRLGYSRSWLYFHIYGGLLFLVLMFMHTGLRMPVGLLTTALWFLALWTVFSGLIGLSLQRWIPRVLTSGLSIEVLYERIPGLIGEIRKRSQALVDTFEDPMKDYFAKNMVSALAGPQRRLIYFLDITGGIKSKLKGFEYLRSFMPAAEQEKLNTLENLFRTKLEIDAHYTLQQALRWWLIAHVPPSILLLTLAALHVFTVLYY